ncbi:MAG: phosphopantetheine-binding protein [Candidatus Eremiobacterota bacterium]
MTVHETIARVLAEIAPDVDLDQVSPDEDVRQALDIDSYDFLNLLVKLHQELGVDIPESDYGKLGSLNDLERYLTARVG